MHSHIPSTDTPGTTPPVDEAASAAARRRALVLLTLILAPLAVLTLVGLLLLWPGGAQVTGAAPGTSGRELSHPEATVQTVAPYECPAPGQRNGPDAGPRMVTCATVQARLETGPETGGIVTVEVPAESYRSGLEAGDRIKVVRVFNHQTGPAMYAFYDFARTLPIGILAGVFALLVVAVARMRGLKALLGLGFAYLVIIKFMLPALLVGESGLLVGLVGAAAIMFVVLYLAHGFSARTTTALAGTLFGLLATAGLGFWAAGAAHLTGLGDSDGVTLAVYNGQVDLSGIVLCGIIVAGLGVLNDVTITQSSAVWELHELAPERSARQLFASAMRIGRDHIASTVYTIAFAYAGAALPIMLLINAYDRPVLAVLTSAQIAEEIVRTLVASIGLVLAIPLTTAVAVAVVKTVVRGGPGAAPPATPGENDDPVRPEPVAGQQV
ncbi:YibE/F family protein [Micromonospora sp. NPDC050417]|uniref:YibE/F family protein n=1 Tax=Micromonospora sp. NPDC050417 TaxID=3364280 RepID=UPI0037901276